MISLILGIIILVKINNYKKNRNFADAKSAGSLGTANLVFTVLQLIPVVVFGLFMIATMDAMVEEANGNIDEIIITFIAGGIMLAPLIALTAFGFITSSKGRKLWKSVNTFGSPDYIPMSDRNNNFSGHNSYSYSYGSTESTSTTTANSSINSGFYNSSGLYGNTTSQNATNNSATQAANVTLPDPVDFSSTTSSMASDSCNYGRSDTGYIPHPKNDEASCHTHSTATIDNKKWKCPSCGKRNRPDETFCKNCGTNRSATF